MSETAACPTPPCEWSGKGQRLLRLVIRQPRPCSKLNTVTTRSTDAWLMSRVSRVGLSSVIRQRSAALQVGLDLLRVRAVGALDLAVEVLVPVVDAVHILVCLVPPPPAVPCPLDLPAEHHRPS